MRVKSTPVLDAAQVEQIIRAGVPMSGEAGLSVESISPGSAVIRLTYKPWMLRPGGSVSGPVLMLAADSAMYAVVLAHIGDQPMALTASLNINFLRRRLAGLVPRSRLTARVSRPNLGRRLKQA